jgi:hypothetical protein
VNEGYLYTACSSTVYIWDKVTCNGGDVDYEYMLDYVPETGFAPSSSPHKVSEIACLFVDDRNIYVGTEDERIVMWDKKVY